MSFWNKGQSYVVVRIMTPPKMSMSSIQEPSNMLLYGENGNIADGIKNANQLKDLEVILIESGCNVIRRILSNERRKGG